MFSMLFSPCDVSGSFKEFVHHLSIIQILQALPSPATASSAQVLGALSSVLK
jgi:hypothetical protein